eukprot:COSAG06_NODE_6582_length_2870_cov_1.899314_5_plen_253_part_00
MRAAATATGSVPYARNSLHFGLKLPSLPRHAQDGSRNTSETPQRFHDMCACCWIWTGLNSKLSSTHDWEWSNGGSLGLLQYQNWAAQQPDNVPENPEPCCLDCGPKEPDASVVIMSYGRYSAGKPCHIPPRPALLRHILPCPALPCSALPCPALPCPALPCSALSFPRRQGRVDSLGSEKSFACRHHCFADSTLRARNTYTLQSGWTSLKAPQRAVTGIACRSVGRTSAQSPSRRVSTCFYLIPVRSCSCIP